MTTVKVPPNGENVEYGETHNGVPCRRIDKDHSRHGWDNRHVDWDVVPGSDGWEVYEYAEPRDVSEDYPEELDGRRFRVVPFDSREHGGGRTEWICDENGKRTQLIRDYMPRSRREPEPTGPEPDMDELPDFMREDHEPEPDPEQTAEPASRKPEKVDKFAYRKALHGRFGPGRELTMAEYVVLGLLWDYASDDLTNAHPGAARLARDLSYSGPSAEETVRKRLRSLARKGFIVCTRKSRGPGSADTYRLTLPEREGGGSK